MSKQVKPDDISWGQLLNKNGDLHPFRVHGFFVDKDSCVNVTIEHGIKVEILVITMEEAQRLGLINLGALAGYCEIIKRRK